MIDMKMYPANSEVDKWKKEMEDKKKGTDFIEVDFLVDMREAERRYKEEYKKDVGKINTLQISFNQWLNMRKFEAARFYVEHNEYNLE